MDTLPSEVIDIIVDKLAEDGTDATTSLKSCSLVSHSFLLRARTHLFNTVVLRKRMESDVPITSEVSSTTLALVKSLKIDFSPLNSQSGKPYPSFGSTVGFPTSLDAFYSLENLVLMHMSWDRGTPDALLRHLQIGPHTFQTLLLTAIQFPYTSDLCSVVRASPQLRTLSCVGVYLQSDGGCAERHVWDHVETLGLVIFHGTSTGGSVEDAYRVLKAVLDPAQCPKALPRLHTIMFWMDAPYMDLFNELLEMTKGTVNELNMIFPSIPVTCPQNLHISHLNVLRLDLSGWDSTASEPIEEAILTLERIQGYLEQDLQYRLKRLEMFLSHRIILPMCERTSTTTTMERAWEAFFDTFTSSDRFGELEQIHFRFATAADMRPMDSETRMWNSFESLRRNGVSVTSSFLNWDHLD